MKRCRFKGVFLGGSSSRPTETPPVLLPLRHRGPVLQTGGAEPSDQAGGRGERAAAARHPDPVGEAEPSGEESGSKAGRSGHVRPHHRRDGDGVHQGEPPPHVCICSQTPSGVHMSVKRAVKTNNYVTKY